ncbi:hypothetical protein [Gemmatimonas sp.]|uniref:hypothetical protein n=1 Tax=Gemmatimonas sp. TaxID=1962908 RepID=UPI0022BBC942|nr:hypothetical protein [Gemmatimonas sp.]MCZ8205349.1 hypothetical protein [Gemmatimonas sp.]
MSASQSAPASLTPLQTAGLAAALGVVAYAIIDATPWFTAQGIPQGAVQFLWLLFVMVGSGLCGWLNTDRAWRWATVLLTVQPLVMLGITLVRGEPDDSPATIPAKTSVFIASVFVATVSPFALIAAGAMASKRRNESR